MSPAESEKQRKLFGTALRMKRGKTSITDTPAGKIAENVSEEKIRDYASKVKKSLPDRINDFIIKTAPKGFWGGKSRRWDRSQGSSVERTAERERKIPEQKQSWSDFLGAGKHQRASPGERTFKSIK